MKPGILQYHSCLERRRPSFHSNGSGIRWLHRTRRNPGRSNPRNRDCHWKLVGYGPGNWPRNPGTKALGWLRNPDRSRSPRGFKECNAGRISGKRSGFGIELRSRCLDPARLAYFRVYERGVVFRPQRQLDGVSHRYIYTNGFRGYVQRQLHLYGVWYEFQPASQGRGREWRSANPRGTTAAELTVRLFDVQWMRSAGKQSTRFWKKNSENQYSPAWRPAAHPGSQLAR